MICKWKFIAVTVAAVAVTVIDTVQPMSFICFVYIMLALILHTIIIQAPLMHFSKSEFAVLKIRLNKLAF